MQQQSKTLPKTLLVWLCLPLSCSLVGSQIKLTLSKIQAAPSLERLFYQERHMHRFDNEEVPLTGVLAPSEPMLEKVTSALLAETAPNQNPTYTTASTSSGQVTTSSSSVPAKATSIPNFKLSDKPFLVAVELIIPTPIATPMDLDVEERTIPCEYCDAMFAKESHLQAHSQIHQRQREFNLKNKSIFENNEKHA